MSGVCKEEYVKRVEWICTMVRKGWGKTELVKKIRAKWDISDKDARYWLNESYKYFRSGSSEFISNLRVMQLERLEKLYREAMSNNDYSTASSVLKSITTLYGLDKTPEGEVKLDKLQFKFGGEPTPQREEKNEDSEE